ncbi:MAG TPA: hypothetical protein VGW38_19525, partial [Chloroflexota bacterium]|nr:hypothetical protein [Chloroflexota bacterium]
VRIEAGGAVPLPQVGLGMASHRRPLSEGVRERLRTLRPAHLRVDLYLSRSGFRDLLENATTEARAIGTALEVALFVSDAAEQELVDVVAAAREVQPPVARWLLFHEREKSTSERWISLGRRVLSQFDPAIPLGSGTNIYFTELNRGRPTPEALAALDLVCYSLNPQVHAFDNASLVESLEGQAATVASARAIAGDRRLAITPVTLRPRFNPNATGPDSGERPPQGDPRQATRFCAAWTVGSLKQLAQEGVTSVTYFETTGNRGVMEDAGGSAESAVYPVYHVLADVTAFAGGEALPTASSNPLAVEALALRHGTRHRVLVANLTANEQRVRLEGLDAVAGAGGESLSLRMLDEASEAGATRSPELFRQNGSPLPTHDLSLTLRPYAVACLHWSSLGGDNR